MCCQTRELGCGIALALCAAMTASAVRAADESVRVHEGRQLFERQFVPGTAHGSGDGLGPLFNHTSCAACHLQGSMGGGGPADVNVVLLAASLRSGSPPEHKKLLEALRSQHASLVGPGGEIVSTIVLHRFSSDARYAELRGRFVPQPPPLSPSPAEIRELQQALSREAVRLAATPPPLNFVTSQRNTTALFGAGLIDAIPDATLRALAAEQQQRGEVSGRVPPIGIDKVGRFGWRGQIERLHDFVLGACANELGLEVPGNEQPRDPLRPDYRPVGLDLTAAQCESLTAFVAHLPAPRQVLPADSQRKAQAQRGRELLAEVGCTACHLERLGPIHGIYSDLLLHDMGQALADPVAAEATLIPTGKRLPPTDESILGVEKSPGKKQLASVPPRQIRPRGYNGGGQPLVRAPSSVFVVDEQTRERVEFRAVDSPVDSEWRTPPLWGVADSGPYLHDGRAATLVEAIALHGGEAEACTKRFFEMSVADRLAVLEFLACLRASRP
jgi:CxxC motif-containing protein (DUF1111 family)